MALYLISYDILKKDAFEYGPLWEHLEEIGAVKILYSEWILVRDEGEASAVYGDIAPLTSMDDRLIVQELTKDAVWDKLLISDEEFQQLLKSARG